MIFTSGKKMSKSIFNPTDRYNSNSRHKIENNEKIKG
jgi:hypothetical protein